METEFRIYRANHEIKQELESPSLKVKREAARCFGELHKQIGQRFKALTISLAKPSLVDELQKCFDAYPFDKSSIVEFPITSLAILRNATDQQMNSSSGLVLEVPKTDIFSKLPDDVLLKLVSAGDSGRDLRRSKNRTS
jgi:hypothetical protein